jgi:hypothetical protein
LGGGSRRVRLTLRVLAALLLLALSACGDAPAPAVSLETQADEIRARAARYLWARQARDGGWHSETYGLMRSGQSLTPFLLGALLTVPESLVPRDENLVRRALAFIVSHIDEGGAVGLSDPNVADYPNYATALSLPLVRRNIDRPALADRLRDRLLSQQFKRATGWSERQAAYGAWGMGAVEVRPPNPGHLDLSMTRYVLESLIYEKGESVREARRRALIFLDRLRTPDGSYFFSTVMHDKNKAGPDDSGSWRGYGTTTADAVLALQAAGIDPKDERIAKAQAWLLANHRSDRVPGLDADGGWAQSMVFYYRATSAYVLPAMGALEAPVGTDWRKVLIKMFAREQLADGSFRNAGTLMKEDDPFIATGLALQALAGLRY